MKVYVLTEDEKQALLNDLELAKCKAPYLEMPGWDKLPLNELNEAITAHVHARFHHRICKALE